MSPAGGGYRCMSRTAGTQPSKRAMGLRALLACSDAAGLMLTRREQRTGATAQELAA